MKRLLILIAVVASVLPATAQTPMPIPLAQWGDSNMDPLSAGGLCVYRAGTSSLATTYTTAELNVANANPVLFNSAGRPASGGVFLVNGVSYKFVLKDFTGIVTPTCVPDTGTTIWTVDDVEAVPGASGSVVATGTAGESLAAGDAVFLSDGQGGRDPGFWYRTDADFASASSDAYLVGMVENAISVGDSGAITLMGVLTVAGPITPGARYWASATPGEVTSTMPTNARQIGIGGDTPTQFFVNPALTQITSFSSAGVGNAVQLATTAQARCTLTTNVPVTVSDVTAATTVYYTPYKGSAVGLYNATLSRWVLHTLTQLSIAVPATTNQMYDLFLDYNDGTPVLAALAWTNDTTRATALTTQDGVYVKTGDTEQRYVCSFRTTGVSGQTEDSFAKRFVWNQDNRVSRPVRVFEATNTWTQPAADTWRQANGSTANQIAVVTGLQESTIELTVNAVTTGGGAATSFSAIGVGGTTPSSLSIISAVGAFSIYATTAAPLVTMPTVGYSFYAWLERVTNTGNVWYGDDNGSTLAQSGIWGWWES